VTPGLRHSGQLTGQGRRLSTSAALKGDDETLAQRSAVANTGNVSLPLPTAAQLHWHRGGKYGISALVHFNMATFFKDGDPGCSPENWPGTNGSSNPASFNPSDLCTDDWASALQPLGIAEAVLGCEPSTAADSRPTWPTEVRLPNGTRYPYRSSVDVLGKFVASMTSAGIGHGFYYSFSNNFFLNKLNCIGGCVPACKHFSSSMKNCDLLPGPVVAARSLSFAVAAEQEQAQQVGGADAVVFALELEVPWGDAAEVDGIVIEEDQSKGQLILSYRIAASLYPAPSSPAAPSGDGGGEQLLATPPPFGNGYRCGGDAPHPVRERTLPRAAAQGAALRYKSL
jgi:hypothetical protein